MMVVFVVCRDEGPVVLGIDLRQNQPRRLSSASRADSGRVRCRAAQTAGCRAGPRVHTGLRAPWPSPLQRRLESTDDKELGRWTPAVQVHSAQQTTGLQRR